jgi:glycosyltransferase involved in cell wall biosynthesis
VRDLPIYVVIPALDEEESLPLVLADLAALPLELSDVVVVDNASRDRTAEVARELGATVLFEGQRGYGAACLRAIEYIVKRVAPAAASDAIVVFLDADYSDYPEELVALVEPILAGEADFVLGSRLLYPEARRAVPLPSRVGNWIASTILYGLHRVRFTDLGPFRAITLSALGGIHMRDRTWGWTVEMQLRACQRGLRIREVPVRYRARHAGNSKISGSLSGGIRAGVKILWVLARHIVARPGLSCSERVVVVGNRR